MKVFITTDMEGVSGALHPEFTSWDGRSHHDARRWLTHEVNAAVSAAFEAGASEVTVLDGHSNGRSILIDELHPEARLMWGRQNRRMGQVEGLSADHDVLMMVGYHGRAGELGVVNHTINSSVISDVQINGKSVGEIEINALMAGELGVPVSMVSGDAAAIEQATSLMPDIATAVTMVAVGAYSALIVTPAKAQELIASATAEGLANLDRMKPVSIEPPIVLDCTFKDTAMADAAAMVPTVERVAPCTCRFRSTSLIAAYPALWTMLTLAVTERWDRTV